MNTHKKYLNELKSNLSQYQKKLSTMENQSHGKEDEKDSKIIQLLQESFKEAGEAYEKLEAASEDEWEKLKTVAGKAFDKLEKNFTELKDATADRLKSYASYIEDQAQETFESSVEYVKNNPFKSILVAGVVGLIIGKVLK